MFSSLVFVVMLFCSFATVGCWQEGRSACKKSPTNNAERFILGRALGNQRLVLNYLSEISVSSKLIFSIGMISPVCNKNAIEPTSLWETRPNLGWSLENKTINQKPKLVINIFLHVRCVGVKIKRCCIAENVTKKIKILESTREKLTVDKRNWTYWLA